MLKLSNSYSKWRALLHKVPLVWLLIAVPIGAAALIVLFVEFAPNKALEAEEQSKHGPAAPWSVQLSTAQSEAAKYDKDAVLISIDASSIDAREPDYNTTLSVQFHFVTPLGIPFIVALDDTDPQNTVHNEPEVNSPSTSYRPFPAPQQHDMLRKAISTVKLSPRDALQRTVPEVLPIAEQHGKASTAPWIELHLAGRWPQAHPNVSDNLPAVWEVRHNIAANVEHRLFWLNPDTGEIVDRTASYP